jgi:hypothetical protein
MELWRIHIRPGSGRGDPVLSYALCLKDKIIGVGWQVERDQASPLSLDDYLRLGESTHGDHWPAGKIAVGLLASIQRDDLVWMRSPAGVYHLCRVKGPWEYRDRAENKDADIANVRPVEIVEVGVSAHVPGKVIACFRPARTIQRIRDQSALAYSERLWAKLTGRPVVDEQAGSSDLFSLISSEDCEDLVSVYLQAQGWLVYPAQRKADTLAYEFVLRHREDFREAVVQVKTGWSSIDLGALPSSVDAVFVFQPNGQYHGANPKAVVIRREDVLDFVAANPRLVPPTTQLWLGDTLRSKPPLPTLGRSGCS